MAHDRTQVYDGALQRRHQRAAHNGHHQERGSQGGVAAVHLLQRNTVDGGEHQRHKETHSYQAVEARLANDEDGPQRAEGGPNPEDGEHLAGIQIFHQHGGKETAHQEQAHSHDVVDLRGGLVDAQVVGILDDEGPGHNLGGHVEELGEYTFAVYLVVPEVPQRFPRSVPLACGLLFLSLRLGHPGNGNHDEYQYHHQADYHIGIPDHGQVVNTDFGFLGLRKGGEDDGTGCVAPVRPKLGQHHE